MSVELFQMFGSAVDDVTAPPALTIPRSVDKNATDTNGDCKGAVTLSTGDWKDLTDLASRTNRQKNVPKRRYQRFSFAFMIICLALLVFAQSSATADDDKHNNDPAVAKEANEANPKDGMKPRKLENDEDDNADNDNDNDNNNETESLNQKDDNDDGDDKDGDSDGDDKGSDGDDKDGDDNKVSRRQENDDGNDGIKKEIDEEEQDRDHEEKEERDQQEQEQDDKDEQQREEEEQEPDEEEDEQTPKPSPKPTDKPKDDNFDRDEPKEDDSDQEEPKEPEETPKPGPAPTKDDREPQQTPDTSKPTGNPTPEPTRKATTDPDDSAPEPTDADPPTTTPPREPDTEKPTKEPTKSPPTQRPPSAADASTSKPSPLPTEKETSPTDADEDPKQPTTTETPDTGKPTPFPMMASTPPTLPSPTDQRPAPATEHPTPAPYWDQRPPHTRPSMAQSPPTTSLPADQIPTIHTPTDQRPPSRPPSYVWTAPQSTPPPQLSSGEKPSDHSSPHHEYPVSTNPTARPSPPTLIPSRQSQSGPPAAWTRPPSSFVWTRPPSSIPVPTASAPTPSSPVLLPLYPTIPGSTNPPASSTSGPPSTGESDVTSPPAQSPSLSSTAPTISGGLAPALGSVPAMEPTTRVQAAMLIQGWEASDAVMVLGGVVPLDSEAELLWAALTAEYIVFEIVDTLGETQLEKVELSIGLTSQKPPLKESSTAVSRNHETIRHRKMQNTEEDSTSGQSQNVAQELAFDVLILLRSSITEHDVNSYIVGAFDEDNEQIAQIAYLMDLRKSGHPAFANASSVSIKGASSIYALDSQRVDPPIDLIEQPRARVSSSSKNGLAAALAVVGVVGLCLAGYFFVKGRRRRQRTEQRPPSHHVDVDGNRIESEIEVGTRTDISSLGDPIPVDICRTSGTTDSKTVVSKSSATPTLDYDFVQEFRQSAQMVTAESQSDYNTESLVTKDDNTLEAEYFRLDRFEIAAPPGRLDIVLETFNGGAPVVQAISDSSPLAGQIHEGDALLTVDGVDVSDMSASDVSLLIAEKQANPVRRFIFAMAPRVDGSVK